MKPNTYNTKNWFVRPAMLMLCLFLLNGIILGQDSSGNEQTPVAAKKIKPEKNTFGSIWIIDNQTVMVPIKGTLEMDIMHRFGTIKNGYKDFLGFFAPSNIRLGFEYVPINNLMVGFSITKANMTWEGYGKYAIIKQTKSKYPVSVTYFGDISLDTRGKDNFVHYSDRLMYFNQLIIARKITPKFSAQVSPSLTHVNIVDGYYYEPGKYRGTMNHDHFAVALAGRYKIKENMGIIVNYDQPITKHRSNNPSPNISFGLEVTTSAHAFQFFLGNYSFITPQRNNYYNHNNFKDGQFLIGFNITRMWNY
jgi:hypothetical protein